MPLVSRLRPRIGDIVEIPAGERLAYAQFTHKHPVYGALLRVLPGLHDERPIKFDCLVSQDNQFVTFFPLGAACNRKIVTVVAHELIPGHSKEFPVFRACVKTKNRRGPYWLWDGEREWQIGDLQPGMEHWPIRGVWNETLLIDASLKAGGMNLTSNPAVERDSHKLRLWFPPLRSGCPSLPR